MRKNKRRSDATTSCDRAEKKKSKHLEGAHSRFSGFGQDAWLMLGEGPASALSQSVVALSSFRGDTMHFTCTGIVVEKDEICACETIVTSASLLRDFNQERFVRIIRSLKIKVRLPNNQVVSAVLSDYNLDRHVVVLTTEESVPDLSAARLNHDMHDQQSSEVFAIGRCFNSGKLMATGGILIACSSKVNDIDNPSEGHAKVLNLTTCRITEVEIGGPLVDSDGNIIGMNLYKGEAPEFLPTNQILECLPPDWLIELGRNAVGCTTWKGPKSKPEESSMPYSCYPEEPSVAPEPYRPYLGSWQWNEFTIGFKKSLESNGYPLPICEDGGMELRCTFHQFFGEDKLTGPTKKVASKISRIVVSLVSFNGEIMFAACSGVFIGWNGCATRVLTSASLVRTSGDENKIYDNLRIEVCLPNKQRVIGTLEHYSLCYNVAVISIMGLRRHHAVKFDDGSLESEVVALGCEVVALGRGFEFGNLMATCGVVADKRCRFDCRELQVSTCKITKVGIGGPLVDFDGNFIGMNFYDSEETPYLPRNIILKVLRHFFDAKWTVADGIMDECTYRWPVLAAYWYYPSLDGPRQKLRLQ